MSLTKNPHHLTKKFFYSSVSCKTCHVFSAFDRVSSTYRTRKIPAKSYMHFGAFSLKSPILAGRQSVNKYIFFTLYPDFIDTLYTSLNTLTAGLQMYCT